MVLGFWDIAAPIVGAPMAGGPGTPALAAAVSNAGGLGVVAGGYLSAEKFAEDIMAAGNPSDPYRERPELGEQLRAALRR